MSWTAFGLGAIVAAAVLFIPGYLMLAALRVAAWPRIVLAPTATAAFLGVLAVVLEPLGIGFGPVSVTVALIAITAGIAVARRRTPWGPVLPPARVSWALAAGLAGSAVWWGLEFVRPLPGPAKVAQAYDTPWHLAIVERIVQTGQGSTLTAGRVVPTTGSAFYPDAWHLAVALVVRLAHVPIGTAVNATTTAEMVLVWSLGIAGLTSVILGRRPVIIGTAVVLGALFDAFPMRLTTYGILDSNLYGTALLPGLLALGVGLLLPGRLELSRRLTVLLIPVALAATVIAQPNGVFAAGVVLSPLVLSRLWRCLRGRSAWIAAAGCLGLVAVGAAAWLLIEGSSFMHRTMSVDWAAYLSLRQGLEAVVLEDFSGHPQPLLAALVLVGVAAALVRRRHRWLVAAHAALSALFVATACTAFARRTPWLRLHLTGFWYHDPRRLAAATIVTAVPLAVLGTSTLLGLLVVAVRRLRSVSLPAPVLAGCLVALLVVTGVVTLGDGASTRDRRLLTAIASPRPALPLTPAKVAFLAEVAAIVPPGQGVLNQPYDGSSWLAPLHGVRVAFAAYQSNWMGPPAPDLALLMAKARDAATDPTVCAALDRLHLQWALRMPLTGVNRFNNPFVPWLRMRRGPWRGLQLSADTAGFQEVESAPGMALYRITACDGTDG